MADDEQGDRPHAGMVRHLIDRLATIKLHAHVLRRRLRRGEQVDPGLVDEQLTRIDREVEEATRLVRDELGTT